MNYSSLFKQARLIIVKQIYGNKMHLICFDHIRFLIEWFKTHMQISIQLIMNVFHSCDCTDIFMR